MNRMRNKKVSYAAPRIQGLLPMALEADFLDGSVSDSINEGGVNSGGQETEDIDFGGEGFNHNWN